MKYTQEKIAKMMDYAVLKPAMTSRDIRTAAKCCAERGIGCLCVRPTDVPEAVAALRKRGAKTVVAAVVGFPHGASCAEVKALEAWRAIADGAEEIDMVMNVGQFLSGNRKSVLAEIGSVAACAHAAGAKVKVILETCLLTPDQIREACDLVIRGGADFVKTSTGFNGPGATPEAVNIMLEAVKGTSVRVKASGGIRDWETAVMYAKMGVTRLGVSGAAQILDGAKE